MQYNAVYVQHHEALLKHASILYFLVRCPWSTFPSQASYISFISNWSKFHFFLQPAIFHQTAQRQERLQHIPHDHQAALLLSNQDAPFKAHLKIYNLLWDLELDIRLLNYSYASSFFKRDVMNLSLAVSLVLLKTTAGSDILNKLLAIIHHPNFDSSQVFALVTNSRNCRYIHSYCQRAKPLLIMDILSRKSHHVSTLSVVA